MREPHHSGMSRRARDAVLMFALIALLAGCTSDGNEAAGDASPTEAQEQAPTEPQPTHEVTRADDTAAPTPEVATDPPSPVEPGSTEAAHTRDLTDLDLSDRHQNGVLLTISEITVEPTAMALEVSAVNGHSERVTLNQLSTYVVDDLGNAYNFSPPETNGELVIEPGAELTGTLVFLGRLQDGATSLDLKMNVINPDESIDLENRLSVDASPAMLIRDIPIPP